MSTYRELLETTKNKLKQAGIKEWESDALILFEDALDMDRGRLLIYGDNQSPDHSRLSEYINKRIEGIPVQYITEKAYFYGYTFYVNESVLIPRFDTEILVERALKEYCQGRILDMCTGSGCIAITLSLKTKADVDAVDISKEALLVAERNAKALGSKLGFIESNLFENVTENYDMIVSNPPYIRKDVIETLDEEVRLREPRLALDGGDDGLLFYKRIISDAPKHLNDEGIIIFEIGCDQADDVSELLLDAGFKDVTVTRDLAGLDRVVCAKYRK